MYYSQRGGRRTPGIVTTVPTMLAVANQPPNAPPGRLRHIMGPTASRGLGVPSRAPGCPCVLTLAENEPP